MAKRLFSGGSANRSNSVSNTRIQNPTYSAPLLPKEASPSTPQHCRPDKSNSTTNLSTYMSDTFLFDKISVRDETLSNNSESGSAFSLVHERATSVIDQQIPNLLNRLTELDIASSNAFSSGVLSDSCSDISIDGSQEKQLAPVLTPQGIDTSPTTNQIPMAKKSSFFRIASMRDVPRNHESDEEEMDL